MLRWGQQDPGNIQSHIPLSQNHGCVTTQIRHQLEEEGLETVSLSSVPVRLISSADTSGHVCYAPRLPKAVYPTPLLSPLAPQKVSTTDLPQPLTSHINLSFLLTALTSKSNTSGMS